MNRLTVRVVLWGGGLNGLDDLGESLTRMGFAVRVANSIEEVRTAIQGRAADLIVAGLGGYFRHPLELLSWLQQVPAAPPVLIVSGGVDVPLYLEAMQRGAFDCVGLPLNENELVQIVSRALETRHLQTAAGGRG